MAMIQQQDGSDYSDVAEIYGFIDEAERAHVASHPFNEDGLGARPHVEVGIERAGDPLHHHHRLLKEEELGPRLLFADGTQSTYLADMSGDGLSDLVRIRRGSVAVWPNLGYGRFGSERMFTARITYNPNPWLGYEGAIGHTMGQSAHALSNSLSLLLRAGLCGGPSHSAPYQGKVRWTEVLIGQTLKKVPVFSPHLLTFHFSITHMVRSSWRIYSHS